MMNPEETIEQLRDELRRVSDERDQLRKTVLRYMAKEMPAKSEEEFLKEIEEIRKNPVPFGQIMEEVRVRLGLAS